MSMKKFFIIFWGLLYFVFGECATNLCRSVDIEKMDGSSFSWRTDDKTISLFDRDSLILSYNYAFINHENVPNWDPRKYAGDYIFPLMGVLGENLIDNAPNDHYHHHGVFWTWPGVYVHESDGSYKMYDLWTSNTQIRQRFNNLSLLESTPQKAIMRVENGWYIDAHSTTPDEQLDSSKIGFAISENEKFYGEKIVSETVQVTVYPIDFWKGFKVRAIDFELTIIPTTKDISLQGAEKKSYGGLTIRFRPRGQIGVDDFITTDEGISKEDMPEKSLRWADYTSKFFDKGDPNENVLSGATLFLYPDFPVFPPTWLTRYYGPLCVGFPGVIAQRFEAGLPVVMKARILLHEGRLPVDFLKEYYEKHLFQNNTSL